MPLPDFGDSGISGKPEDQFQGPTPRLTRRQAAQLEREQVATIRAVEDSYNLGAEEALQGAGLKASKNEMGVVEPLIAPSERFGESLQFDTGETTADDYTDPGTGEKRQIDATGFIKPKKRRKSVVKAGSATNPNYSDPTKLS